MIEIAEQVPIKKIMAPFSKEQVLALTGFQAYAEDGIFHGYTCNKDHEDQVPLIAQEEGWKCSIESCDFTQDWALESSANSDLNSRYALELAIALGG